MSANPRIPEHELPNWMKQAQRGVDWAALLVLAFSLLAAWSFLSEGQVSASNENEHFVFQANDIASAMREGIFYPRWSPYALRGFGAPIPHYYPQVAAYFVALADVFFTNDGVLALRFVYVLAFLIAGASLYSLVAQRSNALTGVFAVVAYLFNPYIGLTVPHLLGDLALFLGLALIPLLLWTVNRLLLREQAIDIFIMTIVTAMLVLTIPRLIPQTIILVLLLIGLHFSEFRSWDRLIWIAGGWLLGLGLAGFFWLPALLESNHVHWYPPLIVAEPQIVRFPELFSQANFLDTGFLTYENYFSLGWGLLLLAGLGGLALILQSQLLRFHGAFLLYGLAVLCLLWAFPQQSELLVSISICFAIGGAYAVNFLKNRFFGSMTLLLLILIIAFALPYWKLPSPAMPITETNAATQIHYETSGYGIAVLPSGLAIPSNLAPDRDSSFGDGTENRVPDSATLSMIEEQAYHGLYQVFSETKSQVIYQRAYFPGWEAWVNNQSIPISPNEIGLMRLEVPAVNAPLSIHLGSTWIRILAWFMSVLAIITSILIWWLRWRRITPDYDNSPLLSKRETQLVFFGLVLMLGLHFILPAWLNPPPRYSLLDALYVRNEVDASFQLLAYHLSQGGLAAGDSIRVNLYWEVPRPILEQYQVRLRLISVADNSLILQTNYSHPSYLPTNRWLRAFVVPQTYVLNLPANLASGEYLFIVDAFHCEGICGEIGNQNPSVELRLSPPVVIE
jgi:hypothetical protein